MRWVSKCIPKLLWVSKCIPIFLCKNEKEWFFTHRPLTSHLIVIGFLSVCPSVRRTLVWRQWRYVRDMFSFQIITPWQGAIVLNGPGWILIRVAAGRTAIRPSATEQCTTTLTSASVMRNCATAAAEAQAAACWSHRHSWRPPYSPTPVTCIKTYLDADAAAAASGNDGDVVFFYFFMFNVCLMWRINVFMMMMIRLGVLQTRVLVSQWWANPNRDSI